MLKQLLPPAKTSVSEPEFKPSAATLARIFQIPGLIQLYIVSIEILRSTLSQLSDSNYFLRRKPPCLNHKFKPSAASLVRIFQIPGQGAENLVCLRQRIVYLRNL